MTDLEKNNFSKEDFSGSADDVNRPSNSNNHHRSSVASSQSLLSSQKLSWRTKIGYSFGHILNDLTGSIWFSYTLLFFQYRFSGSLGGTLILLGQVADAIASPFVGYQSDRCGSMWLFARFGRRKTWHFIGVLMNLVSVPLLYNRCALGLCESAPQWSQFFYYAVLGIINQAGWAASQVTHVSLITDLTSDTNERIALNTYRQAATIASNICLYTVTYFVIASLNDKHTGEARETIRQEDLVVFTYVAYIVCLIGLVFAVLFQILVREPDPPAKPRKVKPEDTKRFLRSSRGSQGIITLLANQTSDDTAPSSSGKNAQLPISTISYLADAEEFERRLKQAKTAQKRWYHWFRSLSFWKITIIYTFARCTLNVTQVYTPLYLQYYLRLPKKSIAVNPFATYFAGLAFSFAAKPFSARFGSRWTLFVGTLFGAATSVWLWFGDAESASYRLYQVYAVAGCLGTAGTVVLISSLALTSDLIGGNTSSGAFVFAAMSFFDKSINGIVIAILEQCKPSESLHSTSPQNYYRLIMVTLTGLPAIVIFLLLLTLLRTNYGRRSRANSVVSMHH